MSEEITLAVHSNGPSVVVSVHQGPGLQLAEADVSQSEVSAALARWSAWRASGPSHPSPSSDVLSELGRLLLPTSISEALWQMVREASRFGRKTRIVVRGSALESSLVPWEMLPLGDHGPLGLLPGASVVRRPEGRPDGFSTPTELRVLLVVADPGSPRFPRLAWLDRECEAIDHVVRRQRNPRIKIKTLLDAVPGSVERTLREFRPNVVHFAGHAETRPTGGVFIMQGAQPNSDLPVEAVRLAEWLTTASVKLAVFTACDTAGSPQSVAELVFCEGVPYVVGMQFSIYDACQPQLARTLYGALFEGATVEEALAEVRQSLRGTPMSWGAPVLLSSGEAAPFAPVADKDVLRSYPNNLTEMPRKLIGRESEQESVFEQVEAGRRLVSLIGVGGVGKTHLAIHLAHRLLPRFPDGVWLIDCAAIVSQADVLSTVATVLSIPIESEAIGDSVQAFLADKRCLLVFDCCEGLVSAGMAGIFERILQAKHVVCMVTSRSALEIEGENALAISPFEHSTLAIASESVELFLSIDRREASPDDRRIIAEICQMLEGVPLAIVLAAERARILDVADLRGLLQKSPLRTIDGPDGRVSQAIQRSLDLLPGVDRRFLWQLCVFSGSFTWQDVSAVYPGEQFDMLDRLTQLCSKSLLQLVTVAGHRRCRLLDTIREYMASVIQDETAYRDRLTARRLHLEHFCRTAKKVAQFIDENKWSEAGEALWPNLSNFRSALAFAAETQCHAEIVALCDALCRTLMEAGFWNDFELFAEEGYRVAEITNDTHLTCRLLGLEGAMAARRGDDARCRGLWTRRLNLSLQSEDLPSASDALLDLSGQAYQAANYEECGRLLDEAEPLVEATGRQELKATLATFRAINALAQGKAEEARRWALEAEQRESAAHDPMLFVNTNVGRVWSKVGELEKATQAFLRVLDAALVARRQIQVAIAVTELAAVFEQKAQTEVAGMCLIAASKIYREISSRRMAQADDKLGDFLATHSDHAAKVSFRKFEYWTSQALVQEALARAKEIS